MELVEILDEWVKDEPIDPLDLSRQVFLPLHSKYMRLLGGYMHIVKGLRRELAVLIVEKREFFLFPSDYKNVKGWEHPRNGGTINKNNKEEVKTYLDADKDIQLLQKDIDTCETKIHALEYIVKQVNFRNAKISNYLKHKEIELGIK